MVPTWAWVLRTPLTSLLPASRQRQVLALAPVSRGPPYDAMGQPEAHAAAGNCWLVGPRGRVCPVGPRFPGGRQAGSGRAGLQAGPHACSAPTPSTVTGGSPGRGMGTGGREQRPGARGDTATITTRPTPPHAAAVSALGCPSLHPRGRLACSYPFHPPFRSQQPLLPSPTPSPTR